jgi:hypothetical protein
MTNQDKGARSENHKDKTRAKHALDFSLSGNIFLKAYKKTDTIPNKNIRNK